MRLANRWNQNPALVTICFSRGFARARSFGRANVGVSLAQAAMAALWSARQVQREVYWKEQNSWLRRTASAPAESLFARRAIWRFTPASTRQGLRFNASRQSVIASSR